MSCGIMKLFKQHLDMLHLSGGLIILAEVLGKSTHKHRLKNIWEEKSDRNKPFVCNLLFQLMKNGRKKVLSFCFCSVLL